MKRIATSVLFLASILLFASAAVIQAQSGGSITVNKNGSPASGVSVVFDLSNMGKASGTPTVTSNPNTTDSAGNVGNVLDLSNMGKAHYDVYEKECVNGQTVVVIVPAGQTPKDDGCKKRKIGGFFWTNDGHDHVTIDTGTHTVTNSNGQARTVISKSPSTFNPVELSGGFNFYHETGEPFYGGYGSGVYYPKSWIGIVGDFTFDHHSETGESDNMIWYMGGVRIAHPMPKFTPYGQFLLGGVHSSFTSSGFLGTNSGSANAFGMKFGGGLDWNASPKVSVRLGQFTWDTSHFGGAWQNNFDYSAGLVVHFGGK
jgi:hypothetical protein